MVGDFLEWLGRVALRLIAIAVVAVLVGVVVFTLVELGGGTWGGVDEEPAEYTP